MWLLTGKHALCRHGEGAVLLLNGTRNNVVPDDAGILESHVGKFHHQLPAARVTCSVSPDS